MTSRRITRTQQFQNEDILPPEDAITARNQQPYHQNEDILPPEDTPVSAPYHSRSQLWNWHSSETCCLQQLPAVLQAQPERVGKFPSFASLYPCKAPGSPTILSMNNNEESPMIEDWLSSLEKTCIGDPCLSAKQRGQSESFQVTIMANHNHDNYSHNWSEDWSLPWDPDVLEPRPIRVKNKNKNNIIEDGGGALWY